IEMQQRVVDHKDAIANDWFQQAQFQRLAGTRDRFKEALKEAMRKDEANLFYVVAFVDDQLDSGNLEACEPYLVRLQQATHDPRATLAAARYHAFANRPARAIEAVERYAQSADAGTPDGLSRSRHAVEMLDQLARQAVAKQLPCAKVLIEAALDKYRYTIRVMPETACAMATLLAFDHRIEPAFDLLTSMKSSISAKLHTTAAVAVLRFGEATPKHFQMVQEWLDAALVPNPSSIPLRMSLAELHALQHTYDAAEPIYRDVLKSEPDNVIALNNLAWMLAPRPEAAEEALKCVGRAIELSGATGELLDTRARIYIARGDFERAIEDLNQALELSRTSLRCFHLALAQFKQLKKNEAVQAFREAKTRGLDQRMIHPSDVPSYKELVAQMGQP
ncbi:MAG: tetratricopeptide repeat protein, partial [Planctomycetes bacterium]|nr:tetratricopeptide repeat protein [Planctomycetota bacterium]